MDNISKFEDYLTPDVAENIGRTFYHGLVVTDNDTPVGGMVWEIKNTMKDADVYSDISWMVIKNDESAELLFKKYDEMIRLANVVKSSFSLSAKTGKEEKRILKERGFSVKLMEGDKIAVHLSEIVNIEFVKKIKDSGNVFPLSNITQRGLNGVMKNMISLGHYGVCEDLPYLPRLYFEKDVSCYSEVNGTVNGLLLCHKYPSGTIEISMIAAIGKDYVKTLPYLIAFAARSAEEIYPPETVVMIDRHNYATLALGEKLFPKGFGTPVYIGERPEAMQ